MSRYATMREAVTRRLRRLRERYGEFPLREVTVENDPDYFEHGRRLAERGWLGDAGAWVVDGDGRALLVRHPDDPERWTTPGGAHEGGERHAETARREVREETGVEVELTGVWTATRTTIVHRDDPDRRLEMLTVLFEARGGGPASVAADDEVLEARWFDEPPAAVSDRVAEKVEAWAARTDA